MTTIECKHELEFQDNGIVPICSKCWKTIIVKETTNTGETSLT